jgi:dTDP-3-amino-3,4,6-trideoxy-alpha-D-glucose transaminase
VEGAEHVYHLYVARHERADELASALSERGVGARGYYRVPTHRQPAMAEFGADAELPATDEAARTHLALPMGPLLTQEDVREVVGALASLP